MHIIKEDKSYKVRFVCYISLDFYSRFYTLWLYCTVFISQKFQIGVIKRKEITLLYLLLFIFLVGLPSLSYLQISYAQLSPSFSAMNYTFVAKWSNVFNGPATVAVDPSGKFVYVADTGNNRIQKFDSNGFDNVAKPVKSWGSAGHNNGEFKNPLGVAVDPSGKFVYVADTGNNRIQKFDRDGGYISQWGSKCIISVGSSPPCVDPDGPDPLALGDGQFFSPGGIAVDLSGNVYVADSQNNRIQKFDNNGKFITTWGSYGFGDGKFRIAADVAVDPAGTFVYAVDKGNDRIQKFDSGGKFITKWGSLGQADGQFFAPLNVAVDPSGNFVYISDTQNARIQRFFNNGTFITSWGSGCNIADGSGCVIPKGVGHLSLGDGQFNNVGRIAFAPSGTFVYIADTGNDRIQVFAPDMFLNRAINLTNSDRFSSHPKLVTSGLGVYEIWQSNITSGDHAILFRRSTNGGASFGNTINLSNNPGLSENPQIAALGNNVSVVWTDRAAGNGDVYFRRSTNGGASFGNTINLSNNPGLSENPQIATFQREVFVVWDDYSPGHAQILFKRSTDVGATFGSTINLSSNPGSNVNPQIGLWFCTRFCSSVHVTWLSSNNNDGNWDVLFKRSTDGGATFGNTKNLSNSPGTLGYLKMIDNGFGGDIFVVWADNTPGKSGVFFTSSIDNGLTFSVQKLSNTPGPFSNLQVDGAIDFPLDGRPPFILEVYVMWYDNTPEKNGVFLIRSANTGSTVHFGSPINILTDNRRSIHDVQMVMLLEYFKARVIGATGIPITTSYVGRQIYVVWNNVTHTGRSEILFTSLVHDTNDGLRRPLKYGPVGKLSTTLGSPFDLQVATGEGGLYATWLDDTTVGAKYIYFVRGFSNGVSVNLSNNDESYPQISASGKNVYMLWQSSPYGNDEIFFAKSTDNGTSFGSTINLTKNTAVTTAPQISSPGNDIYVVWVDNTAAGHNNTFFKKSTDGGATFGSTINLSNDNGQSSDLRLFSSANNVYVVWSDNTTGNDDIYFKKSTDGGATFGGTINLSNNPGLSKDPQIAAFGNNVYVVWSDNTPTKFDKTHNRQIFFKKSTDGGATFGGTINLSNNHGFSLYPKIDVSGGNINIVWQDNATGNWDTYYTQSRDNGTVFYGIVNLSHNAGNSEHVQISTSKDNIYAVWDDDSLGSKIIFFKRSK